MIMIFLFLVLGVVSVIAVLGFIESCKKEDDNAIDDFDNSGF